MKQSRAAVECHGHRWGLTGASCSCCIVKVRSSSFRSVWRRAPFDFFKGVREGAFEGPGERQHAVAQMWRGTQALSPISSSKLQTAISPPSENSKHSPPLYTAFQHGIGSCSRYFPKCQIVIVISIGRRPGSTPPSFSVLYAPLKKILPAHLLRQLWCRKNVRKRLQCSAASLPSERWRWSCASRQLGFTRALNRIPGTIDDNG